MSCMDTFAAYALRSLGTGERQLPKSGITLCEQFVLTGSGALWNIYLTVLSLLAGFFLAQLLALGKASPVRAIAWPVESVIYFFRGTPFFLQLFFAYSLLTLLPAGVVTLDLGFTTITFEPRLLARAHTGGLIVLVLNTAAYSAEIFYGAMMAVPKGDIEAADAMGMGPFLKFRRIIWPTMMRLAWPAYTNEGIFVLHATAVVFLSSFPAREQKGDILYYANYFADKTFNPFVAYPIAAFYFVLIVLVLIGFYAMLGRFFTRHQRG